MKFHCLRFKEAWILAKTLDTQDAWLELGKKAITHLDIELGETYVLVTFYFS